MRTFAPLALGLMIAVAPVQPALAAETSGPQTIAMEAVALPIIVDGKLVNYVFCSIRLDLFPNVDGAKVRAKEEYFRDDLVRVGHRNPFVRKDDYNHVDEARVRAEILRIAPSLVGPNMVRSAAITKQAAQKVVAAPSPQPPQPRQIAP